MSLEGKSLLYVFDRIHKVRIEGSIRIEIKRLANFDEWLNDVKDNMTRIA